MSTEPTYDDRLKVGMSERIDALELSPAQKEALRARWLDQVVWMGRRAKQAQRSYYVLRLLTILGSVALPAIIAHILGDPVGSAHSWIRWAAFAISLLVAASAAIEEFLHFGEKWRHYRRTSEILKIEGWQFILLTGPYHRFDGHADAYRTFTGRVEDVLAADIEQYFERVIGEERQRKAPLA